MWVREMKKHILQGEGILSCDERSHGRTDGFTRPKGLVREAEREKQQEIILAN